MKKVSVYIILLFFMSCKQSATKEPGFKIIVNVNNKLDSNKFKNIMLSEKGEFYSVSIDLINETDTISEIITMSCTWQENYIFNNKNAFLLTDSICKNNFPNEIKIKPKQTKKFQGIMWLSDALIVSKDKDLRLGFVVVKKHEVSYSIEFKDVLRDKINKGQDIIWGEPVEFNK